MEANRQNMTANQALAEAKKLWGDSARVKRAGKKYVVGFTKFGRFFLRGDGSDWQDAMQAAIAKHKRISKKCTTEACNNPTDDNYSYCVNCRLAKRRQEFIVHCKTPWCNKKFVMQVIGDQSPKDVEDKFCPDCRSNFSSQDGTISFARVRALRLQVEMSKPITDIIIEAGRSAFDAFVDREGEMPDTVERFAANLGVTRKTLHDWLQFFFGLEWPDFKRKYICAAHCCSIVDVSNVTAAGKLSKYYPIDKFRKKSICSCPIWGDRLILVDLPPAELQPEKLNQVFKSNKIPWIEQLQVVTGSHIPLLDQQEDT